MATPKAAAEPKAEEPKAPDTIIIDFGKKKRKRVRQLRKGKGPLMEAVQDTITHLREQDTTSDNAPNVVVVVREKKRRGRRWF